MGWGGARRDGKDLYDVKALQYLFDTIDTYRALSSKEM